MKHVLDKVLSSDWGLVVFFFWLSSLVVSDFAGAMFIDGAVFNGLMIVVWASLIKAIRNKMDLDERVFQVSIAYGVIYAAFTMHVFELNSIQAILCFPAFALSCVCYYLTTRNATKS